MLHDNTAGSDPDEEGLMYVYDKPDNLVELFEESVRKYGGNQMYGTKNSAGEYEWVTYAEVGQRVDHLRGGLKSLQVGKDDSVGYIGNNSVEWVVAAFASYGLGARYVPMYEAELVKTWKYIISDSGLKVLFVANPEVMKKVEKFKDEIPTLEHIIAVYGAGPGTMPGLESLGEANPVPSLRPSPHDIAGLIYTSGTTGDPKGVLLSHGNFTSNAQAGWHQWPELDQHCVSISILPWAHSYGQTGELYNMMQFGGSVGFMESVQTLGDDMLKVRPTNIVAVPRVFNKIYDGLWTKMNEEGGLPLKLFSMGVEAAKKKRELAEQGKSSLLINFKVALADKVVFSKIRARFGGRATMGLTASAAMSPEICKFFHDIGLPIYECYGLSETSPCVTMSSREKFRFGSIGPLVEKVRVEIDTTLGDPAIGDGEIIVYGPNVMQGYLNKPEETKAVMTADGGFRTGDRGRLDEDGFLYITGRIKEQYKLENGKYVFPAALEEDIKLLHNVANAMIYGDGRAYNICFVVPDFIVMEKLCKENGWDPDPQAVIANKAITGMIEQEIKESLADHYGGYEIPKRFVFIAEDFSVESGCLTQTMKLKRRVVIDKYKDLIEGAYA